MKRLFLVILIINFLPSPIGSQPSASIPLAESKLNTMNDIQRVQLIQKLLFLYAPAVSSKTDVDDYLTGVFNIVDDSAKKKFLVNYENLIGSKISFRDSKDAFTQLTALQLEQCNGVAAFSEDVDHMVQMIQDNSVKDIYKSIYDDGISFLLRDNRQNQLKNDLAELNKVVKDHQRTTDSTTVGGAYNRFVLMLWEISPYIDKLKTQLAKTGSGHCVFYRQYVRARRHSKLIKLLTSLYKKYEWSSIKLGKDQDFIKNSVKNYIEKETEFRKFSGKKTDGMNIVKEYFETRKSLISKLSDEVIDQLLLSLIQSAGLRDKIINFENIVDNAKALNAAVSMYAPYQDPSGTHLDMFYQENKKIWLRANLTKSISQSTINKDSVYKRIAKFSLIIRKGNLPVITKNDFERVGDNLNKFQSGSNSNYEAQESVIEIPIGVKMLDLNIKSAKQSNARIAYPDSPTNFNVEFKSNPVWGVFESDHGKQEELLRHLGIPSSFGFKLKGITPHIDPEKFKFHFEVIVPELVQSVLDTVSNYDLTFMEMQEAFSGSVESIGQHIKKKLQARIENHIKLLLIDHKEYLTNALDVFPFVEGLDKLYLMKDSMRDSTLIIKGRTVQIQKGRFTPFEYHFDYTLDKSNWPEALEFPNDAKFGFKLLLDIKNGHTRQHFEIKTKINLNSAYLAKIKNRVIDLAEEHGIFPDSAENRVLINIFNDPIQLDIGNRSAYAPIKFKNTRIGAIYYRNGQFDYTLDLLSEELITQILKDQTQVALNKIEGGVQSEICNWINQEKFFIGSIPGWHEVNSDCGGNDPTFKKTWQYKDDASKRFGFEGLFEGAIPKITKVDYSYLSNELSKYSKSFRDSLNNFRYVKFGNGKFGSSGNYEVPMYLDLDFLESDTLNPITYLHIKKDGGVKFGSLDFKSNILKEIGDKLKKTLNTNYFSRPMDFDILGQEVKIDSCYLVDIKKETIGFRANLEVFSGIKVFVNIIYQKGNISFEPTNVELKEIEQLISIDLGVANINATANLSLSPIGIKGIADIEVFGIAFPPINYLLTKKGLEYKLATAILIPGVYPVAPGVVMIDPRISLDIDQKKVRANTMLTIGASEEARATARLIKINTFLTFPYEWGEDITYGGDLVALMVLPLMKGRGIINPKETYFEYREGTSKLISEIVDYESLIKFNGEARHFTGSAHLNLLDEIQVNLDLSASIPSGKLYLFLEGASSASLVFAEFDITAKTKIIPGPLAPVSALLNTEMGFNMSANKSLLGVELGSVSGEASIEQARFNVGLLGAEFGITVPGPNDLIDDMILDLLKMMFDFKIDIKSLLSVPNLEDIFKTSVSLPVELVFGGTSFGKMGNGGSKIKGNNATSRKKISKPQSDKSNQKNGNSFEGNISYPTEVAHKIETRKYSCNFFWTCEKEVKVPYDKFKYKAWPSLYTNLANRFKEGSMIFSDETHPQTGNKIKSLIAPITISSNTFKVHDERDKFDLLLTNIKIDEQGIYQNNNDQFTFCEECEDEMLGVTFSDALDIKNKFSINLGFDKKSDQVVIFTSYNLTGKENSARSGISIIDNIDSLAKYQKSKETLACKTCINLTDSALIEHEIFLSQSREFFIREKGFIGSKYVSVVDGKPIPDIYMNSNEEGSVERIKVKIQSYLNKIDIKYNYIAVDENQLFAFESIPDIAYHKNQTDREDNKLYELSGKVWIRIDEQIFLNLILQDGGGNPKADESPRTWISNSLKNDTNDRFSRLLSKVLNEIIKTNGNLTQELIEIEEFGAQLMVIETSPTVADKWTADGTKTFIVVNPGTNKKIKKGTKIDFNLSNFGSYYGNKRMHFESLDKLKEYFERPEKPLLRNFVITALTMEEKLNNYYGIHLADERMLLAKFIESTSAYNKYQFLKIKSGELDEDITNMDSTYRLSVHQAYLTANHSPGTYDYSVVHPFNKNTVYWKEIFRNFDFDKGYWIANNGPNNEAISSLRQGEESEIYYSWFNHVNSTTPSLIETASFNVNLSSLEIFNINQVHNLFPILNKAIDRSSKWYSDKTQVTPFSLFRDYPRP